MNGLGKVKAVWLVLLFTLGVSVHAWFYISSVLALPDISDEYARSWQFQLIMFCIFRLPLWLAAFVFTLVVRQFVALRKSKQ
jgi:hypothetical protein